MARRHEQAVALHLAEADVGGALGRRDEAPADATARADGPASGRDIPAGRSYDTLISICETLAALPGK